MMIRQFLTIDNPDKRDYNFEDYAAWEELARPRHQVTVYDQWNTPACTRFALGHIVNGNNLNEYKNNWQEYKQVNPIEYWNKGWKIKSLQATLSEFRRWGLIEWRVVIKSDKVNWIKKALSMWMFVFTGSDNWLRGIYKSPRNYMKRKDWKIVWHAWSIVWDEPANERFVVINSFWDDRWDSWYFYLPYKDIDSCFSLNCIVDKDDSWKFAILRQKEKAKQLVALAKELYSNGDTEIKKFFEDIQLSAFINDKYQL